MEPKLEGHFMISQDATAKVSDKPRPALKLGNEFEKRLSSYAGSAIAAGVGLLAMAKAADAKVVYTPAHIKIPVSDTHTVPLDLNHDGKADFSFANQSYINTNYGFYQFNLQISPSGSANEVWGKGGSVSLRFASALPAGRKVGADKSYFQGGRVAQMAAAMIDVETSTQGQFPYTHGRYLGLQFVIAGRIHYGWARVTVPAITKSGITAVVTGYAYETIPGKPIITGKTKGPDVITLDRATLGHLARGADHLSVAGYANGTRRCTLTGVASVASTPAARTHFTIKQSREPRGSVSSQKLGARS
jgi:hypothetical protein